MLDPSPEGIEYIEIYNTGFSPINAKDLLIGQVNSQNAYTYLKALSNKDLAIYPRTYWAICSNADVLKSKHTVNENQIIEIPNLPALNNAKSQ